MFALAAGTCRISPTLRLRKSSASSSVFAPARIPSKPRIRAMNMSGVSGRRTKLPPGKILIPGVVTHHTITVEHPRLVADRILRFARIVGRENVIAGTDCGFAQAQFIRARPPPRLCGRNLRRWSKARASPAPNFGRKAPTRISQTQGEIN